MGLKLLPGDHTPLFDDHFDQLEERQAKQRSTALILGTPDPDETAEALRVGEELGIPAQAVQGAPEVFKGQAAQKRASTALQSAPKLQEWLGNPLNGALAKDDLDNLTWFEGWTPDTEFGKGLKTGVIGVKQVGVGAAAVVPQASRNRSMENLRGFEAVGDLSKDMTRAEVAELLGVDPQSTAASMAHGFLVAEPEQRQRMIDGMVSRVINSEESVQGIRDLISEFSADMQETQGRTVNFSDIDDVSAFGDWLAFNSGQSIPFLASLIAAGAAGGAPLTAGTGYALGVGDINSGLIEEGVTDRPDLALAGGVPYAALEALGPAAAPFRRIGTDVMTEVAAGYFKRLGREVPKQAIEEFINEAGQEIIKDITVAQGTGEVVELNDETLLRWFNSGMAGAAGGLTFSPVTAAQSRVERDMERADAAGTTAQRLEQIDEMAAQSKVKERAPAKFQEALEAAGMQDQDLYVSAEGMREYFQAKDVELDDETLRAWGVDPADFSEKLASGGDVAVPASSYAAQITGTDDAVWLRDNAVFSPDEMSVAEAAAFNDQVRDILDEAIAEQQEAEATDRELRAADVQIYDEVFSQLRAAGRSPDVAQQEAGVWSAFWRTMGERYGEDPLALARSMGVSIRGPQTPEARRRRDQLDIMLGTLRQKGDKALAPRGQGVLDFIKANGGIRDRGGDVEALDAPAGIVTETAAQVAEREAQPNLGGSVDFNGQGRGLDEIGRMLIDAGYFPEFQGGANIQADGTVVDEAAIALEAIAEAIGGRDRFLDGEGPDAELTALNEQLQERAIDLSLPNDEIAAALDDEGGQTYGQRGGQGGQKRGSIVLPSGGLTDGQTVINLFESANLSTFLHESGHFFLEAFNALASSDDAPAAMKADLEAIGKFLGAESLDGLSVEQHETWARGFEAYLMEGKAPSLALTSAFARFKAWLSRIYRTVAGLNVKLTPEIREVMDRMLATDAEIAEARADLNMRPLFTEAAPAGMSDADFATYQRMAQRGSEQAEQSLMRRTMDKVRRETQKWFKDEKAAVRAEVEDRANRMPVYRLTEVLANQAWLTDAAEDVPDIQIDRDILVEQYGDGVLGEISRTKIGGKRAIYKKGGEHPDLVAEMFGFASTPEMIDALQNAGKRKDYISGETDRIMNERHGDPLTDGSIEEAAALAVHSQQQAEVVTTEARAIAKRLGMPTKDIKAKVYKARAQAMIGRMTVRQASRPEAFLQAERKAARAAERAFTRVARGGRKNEEALAEAMQAKEQQILNQFLYREARDFSDKLQRGREKMRSYQKTSVRKAVGLSYVDEETGDIVPGHIEQIDALLDRFDFRQRSNKQIDNSEALRDYVDRMVAEGRGDELSIDPKYLDASLRTHYTRLSVDDLQGLFDTIANIDHMGRRRAQLIDRQNKRNLDEVAVTLSDLVRKRYGKGKSEKQTGMVKNFFNLLLRVDTIAADIDGQEIGDFYTNFKKPLDQGAALEQKMNSQSGIDIAKIFEVYSAKEKRDLNTARVIDGGNGHPWTKQQILSVALNTGNRENRKRILDRKVHESVRLTEGQLEALLNTLDKRDWDFVQSVWDYVDGFKKESFDTAERMTGVRPKEVKAEAFTNKHGSYRGGYYPVSYDPAKSRGAQMDAESALDQFMSAGRGAAAKVADGFTKQRAASGGGRALNYDFSVMMKHTRDTTRLIALGEPVQNARRILGHGLVGHTFREAGAQNLMSTLDLFLHDVASGPVYNNDPINGLSRIIKNNFTLSRLAFNFKTVALQVTGLGQSAAVIGKMNLLKGFADMRRRPDQVAREVMDKSSFMAERQTTFQKDVYDAANELRQASPIEGKWRKAKNVISAAGFTPMIKVQFYVVDLPTWLGAYRAEIERNGGDEDGAIHFADRMVDRSQGGGFMTDRNALERGTLSRNVRQADFVRLWTTLGGYMVTKLNRGYLTARGGARDIVEADTMAGRTGAALNMATDMTLLYMFEAAFMGLAYALLSEDEDDEDIRNFMIKEVTGAAIGGVPFVRESVGAFNGYGAGGVLSSALEIPANIWTQVSQGENDKAFRRSVADAAGLFTGLPTTQSMRIIEELIEGEDGSIAEAVIGRNPLEY